jgi:hypothetical protein
MVGNDTARDTERDLRTILLVQAIRAFLYGLGSVLIGLTLADGGFTDAEVGLVGRRDRGKSPSDGLP